MSKQRAFVKYTKQGKIIPGSLIVTTRGGYPNKTGAIWREVSMNLCCDDVPEPSFPSNCIEFVVNTTESTFFTFTAESFTQEYTYTITWGDGQSDSGSSSAGAISPEHTYAESDASYTVSVCFSNISIINNLDFPGFD
jgi:hypothetical protein